MSSAETRYGFYLRPSFAMAKAQVEIHELLRHQYGLRVAGTFMPHATIKGFFRSDAAVATMVERLDAALAGRRSFPVYNGGAGPFGRGGIGIVVQYLPDGSPNAPLQALHEAAIDALLPLVHPDCDFTPNDPIRDRFVAHLTLAMADVPPQYYGEIVRFVQAGEPIGPASFTADTFHLWAFTSDDWSGRWWETLRWELLHSWVLGMGDR